MSFLFLEKKTAKNKYEKLHYLENPFPTRGRVVVEIYVERPELETLKNELTHFLLDEERKTGSFWALEASRGIGKSNFLQHLEWEIKQGQERNLLSSKIICEYIPGGFIGAREIVERLILAVGEERFRSLLSVIEEKKIKLPETLNGTDLWRFFESSRQRHISSIENTTALFLMKWLMGHTITAEERKNYGLWSKDRVPPAAAFPYLKTLLTIMRDNDIIDRILLLMDEFEDVQKFDAKRKTEFIQALKNMLNFFNWDILFVILAGQEGVFTTIGSQYTSLADRWKRVSLKPIERSEQALQFARAYMRPMHKRFCEEKKQNEQKLDELEPLKKDIQEIYISLMDDNRNKLVTQRDLLDKLYEWVENKTT